VEVGHRKVDLFDDRFRVEHGRGHLEQRRLHRRAEPGGELTNQNRANPLADLAPIVGRVVVGLLGGDAGGEDAVVVLGERRELVFEEFREA
jgi:hypothetical protein